MIKEFVIPVQKDDLLLSGPRGQYFVENLLSIRMLPDALDASRKAIQTDGSSFILKHFDTFFSIMVHGNKLELPVIMRAFARVVKGIEILIQELEDIGTNAREIDDEERQKLLCINKMLAYLFSWFMCYIEDKILKNSSDSYSGKNKKATKTDVEEEWMVSKEKALEFTYRWLQLPLQKLWQPPIVENEFIALLTKVCYKILEEAKGTKQKQLRQTIFHILGISMKKYNAGISSVIRMIQLVKLHDVLATHIANGIIVMVTECGCNGLIREVMKELGQSELTEAGSRNISIFLETIATLKPDVVLAILDDVTDYLGNEHYSMRNCALGILAIVVQKALTNENLTDEQKDQRDECLNNLNEHILDCSAYVRSKVLQLWQKLCCESAIPLSRYGPLLAAATGRLEDKSANVRKQSLQLLRALLLSNPFTAELNKGKFSKSLTDEETELKRLQTELASRSGRNDSQRLELWKTMQPKIKEALSKIVETNNNKIDTEDDDEDEEEIDLSTGFEHVRHLMLKEKIVEAIKYLWKMCVELQPMADIKNLSPEDKEVCFHTILFKTFMESEDNTKKTDENQGKVMSSEDKILEERIEAQKLTVTYLKSCFEFSSEWENTIPIVKNLLFSTTATDAIEACTLLGTASQFGIIGSTSGIREALFQVFHRDQSVRNNVAQVYKEIYLSVGGDKKTERQKALAIVKALIELVKALEPAQSPALAKLIISWYKNQEINDEVLQILWENFSMKAPETTALDSRTALVLITMIAQAESGVITGNLRILTQVGLGERAKTDLLLARDVCRALLKIQCDTSDIKKPVARYPNDHEVFKLVLELLEDSFMNSKEDGYVSFATDAINLIYHLANQPAHLMKRLLINICDKGNLLNRDTTEESSVPVFLLSKLLYIVGHIAIQQMVHLDTAVYKELKRRDTLRKLKKEKMSNKALNKTISHNRSAQSTPTSAALILRNKESNTVVEDNGEAAVEGAQDDADAEFIHATLESQVVAGDGLLTRFIPLVMDVCQCPDKYNDANLQASGALALCKMMTVSSTFCEESLQLLVTILERSSHPGIKSNILVGLGDLSIRYPNEVEPWMTHVYRRLRDEDVGVRTTCVRVLSNLIMGEMVRVRGQISELALCIVDKDSQISQGTKEIFNELAQKGNNLYNIVPDILSRLTDPELDLSESDFHEVIKHILSLVQKEKHMDSIIDKICARFVLSTTERQWRDFSYCLTLLQFSEKSIRRLIDTVVLLKSKLYNSDVQKALQTIIENTSKKQNCVRTKAACAELETKIEELLKVTKSGEKPDNEVMPPPPVPVSQRKNRKMSRKSRRKSSSEEDDEDFENDPVVTSGGKARDRKKRRLYERTNNSNSDTDSDTEDTPPKTPTVQKSRKSTSRKTSIAQSTETPSEPKRMRHNATPSRPPRRTSARLRE